MKARVFFFLLSIAAVAFLWSCATMSNKAGGVVTDARGIVIPATTFTDTDQAQMNHILAKYDKALYKIETRADGRPSPKQGSLHDIYTDKKLAAAIADNLSKQGFTRSAVRVGKYVSSVVGTTTNAQQATGPAATPVGGNSSNPQRVAPSPVGGSSSNPQKVQQDKLISELMPILEKYNK